MKLVVLATSIACFAIGAHGSASASCYALLGSAVHSGRRGLVPPVQCPQSSEPRYTDFCFLACGLCTVPEFAVSLDTSFAHFCTGEDPLPNSSTIIQAASSAILNASAMQGSFWIEDNVTEVYMFLLSGMPRRDMMVLFSEPFMFMDFLSEHVRLTLNQWPFSNSLGVPWDIFLANVAPYSFLDEKRDFYWRWRARFNQLLTPLLSASNISSVTEAMHVIANALPTAQLLGMLSYENASMPQSVQLVAGQPITWHSETSPEYLSPSQVAYRGASCTGTAIMLGAAARSVGIPARLAGCSESVARGDDHHWIEFYDPSSVGFAGDFWHTKEGTSKGNEGGPWDSPSGPMLGCLQGVVPGSTMDTMWASSWASPFYLPALWSNDTWSQSWAFAGGENRCGAYCMAWGCGNNNSQHWTQAECGPM